MPPTPVSGKSSCGSRWRSTAGFRWRSSSNELDFRIRGAYPLLNPYTNRIVGYPGNWALYGDYGAGIRFDVPQLGLHTIRIDFAKGVYGTHTSFGIGQSF